MIENIFVIFAPLTGGNHLANIVSTADRFSQRFDVSIYENNVFHAHPDNKNNYTPMEIELKAVQYQSNVFCCHLAEYLTAKTLTEQYLLNRKYILLEFPQGSRNNFFRQRISKGSYFCNQYMLEELSTMYSIDTFSKLTGEKDLAKINVDLLFNQDISDLLTALHSEFGLKFDQQETDKLHQLWIYKNGFK